MNDPAGLDNRLVEPLASAFERIPEAWKSVTDRFAHSAEGQRLCAFVDARRAAGATVYPAPVFRALELCTPEETRVVVLGQDPYHGPGQAQGLAFSVAPGCRLPPSLRNLLAEVRTDTGEASRCRDDLTPWASQGVLLLNSVLTVEEGAPQSHAGHGWELFTDAMLAALAGRAAPTVFVLWGASAQRKRVLVECGPHAVVVSNHPSPLSARRPPAPFLGSRPFTQVNAFLAARRRGPAIRW